MKNYTIYVANQTSGGGTSPNPITPNPNPTSPNDEEISGKDVISALKGIKAGIIATIVYKVAQLCVNVAKEQASLKEEMTGEYKYIAGWKNYEKIMSNITNPIGFTLNTIHSNLERERERMTYEENVKIRGGFLGDYNI